MLDNLSAGLTVTAPEKRGNGNAGLRTEIITDITRISPEEWSRVYPQICESYHFFKTLQESGLEQFEWHYILVYDAGELVGVAPCFLMHYPLDTTIQGPIKSVLLKIKKRSPNFMELRVLVCGLPMGQGRIGVVRDAGAVVQAICRAMESLAASRKISILGFKDFGLRECEWLDVLQAEGYYKFESMPSTEMAVPYRFFDEYVKTLNRVSRDGLKRKLKEIDRAAPLPMEIREHLSEDELDQVYALYTQTLLRHGEMSFEIMTKDFFRRLSGNMPAQTRYFLWRLNGRIVAFALCLVSAERMIDYYLGFDYALAHDLHLYFTRFRDLMKWCIENKIPVYEMGNTGYEAKRRLGFEFVRLFVYAKHLNKFVNPFFHLLCRCLRPENFDATFKHIRKKS
ncbi:MAG: GNAT family N-acetyltransferase [Candidatus Omnitrophota bacterium]|jgi:predicted N-acyltransferase